MMGPMHFNYLSGIGQMPHNQMYYGGGNEECDGYDNDFDDDDDDDDDNYNNENEDCEENMQNYQHGVDYNCHMKNYQYGMQNHNLNERQNSMQVGRMGNVNDEYQNNGNGKRRKLNKRKGMQL